MKFADAYILAATKRKTRRIRTALVVIVSSLLFAVLFFLAFTAEGLVHSAKQVDDVGFNGRYMVSINPSFNQDSSFDPAAKQKEVESAMDAELRSRKIKVTTETRQDPSYAMELGRRMRQYFAEQQTQNNLDTEKLALSLGRPTAFYHFSFLPVEDSQFAYQPDTSKDPVVEELEAKEDSAAGTGGFQKSGAYNPGSAETASYYTVERGMLSTQVQPGQSYNWKPGDAYPVAISYNYMEKLAQKSFAHVSNKARVEGYRKLMKQFAGRELAYCYRNGTAKSRLESVVAYNKRVSKDNDARTNPIGIPVCGGFDEALLKRLKIVEEPNADDPKPLFPSRPEPAPQTKQVRLKIVGFVPGTTQYNDDIVGQTISGVSSLPVYSSNAVIFPTEVVSTDPLLKSLIANGENELSNQQLSMFADFASRKEQADYIAQSCKGDECVSGSKPVIASFGNIEVAVEGLFKTATKFVLLGVLVIMIIAGLMTMFTISKVIADSIKEIAVFRALGARRRDIAHIYYMYGAMLTFSAGVLAVVLAAIGAVVATKLYGERIALTLVYSTGAYNTDVHVSLFGARPMWLLLITGAMVLAALIGISIPLFASLRRKLIEILREE